jgi:hypothetical protein
MASRIETNIRNFNFEKRIAYINSISEGIIPAQSHIRLNRELKRSFSFNLQNSSLFFRIDEDFNFKKNHNEKLKMNYAPIMFKISSNQNTFKILAR